MATNIEVKCNFTSVFAKYDTVDELKAVANNICGQVKEAFDTRVAEIKSGNTGVVVEVEVSSDETQKPEPKSKSKNNKTAGAKEMAEKFKKQEKQQKSEAQKETKESKDNDTLIAITDT